MTDALIISDVKKAYADCVVLDGATFSVAPGECVGLCGENGAGKTTLLKIILGLVTADSGTTNVLGKPPSTKRSDVGMVHQHFSLVPALTVAENVWLGAEPMRHGMIDRAAAAQKTQTLAAALGIQIDPERRVETLTVGEKQRVELLKAFRSDAKLLLLDEPTAVLGPQDIDAFLALLRKLNERGVAIVLVTHKLKEIAAVCSRAVVLRKGRIVAEAKPTPEALPKLADAMVGGNDGDKAMAAKVARSSASTLVPRLTFKHVRTNELADVTMTAHCGEIIGIAGVEGNGQEALFRAVVGIDAIEAGEATLDNLAFVSSPAWLRTHGVRAIAGDRHVDAVLPNMSASSNVRLGHQEALPAAITRAMQRFDVRPMNPALAIEAFSGGNQQKIMFAREVGQKPEPSLIVVNQPTRGIDFLARNTVWQALAALADKGATVIVISSDVDELRALCDRVTVIYRGKLGPLHDVQSLTDVQLGAEMAGTA